MDISKAENGSWSILHCMTSVAVNNKNNSYVQNEIGQHYFKLNCYKQLDILLQFTNLFLDVQTNFLLVPGHTGVAHQYVYEQSVCMLRPY